MNTKIILKKYDMLNYRAFPKRTTSSSQAASEARSARTKFCASHASLPAARSNREMTVKRFVELMQSALKQCPIKRKMRVSKVVKERRLEENKQRSNVKRARSRIVSIED